MRLKLGKQLVHCRHVFIIYFSGITFNDVLARYGLLEDTPRAPFIPGFECSGEVLEVGTNVTHVDVSLYDFD